MVITGRKVLKFIAVIAVVVAVVFGIREVISGTPLLDVLTENYVIWIGALLPVFVVFFLFGDEKKDEEDESQFNKQNKGE